MADMRNLVERLERVVGRLEAVSHASDTHCGYGDSAAKGKQYTCQQNALSETWCPGLKFFYLGMISSLELTC